MTLHIVLISVLLYLQIIESLDKRKAAWVAVDCSHRAAMLRECMHRTIQFSKEASAAAVRAKGSYGSGLGEEWMNFIPVVFGFKEYADSMESRGEQKPLFFKERPDGQYVATVSLKVLVNLYRLCPAV